jgi:hypothetical protein
MDVDKWTLAKALTTKLCIPVEELGKENEIYATLSRRPQRFLMRLVVAQKTVRFDLQLNKLPNGRGEL